MKFLLKPLGDATDIGMGNKNIEPHHVKMALSHDLRLKTLREKGFRISFVGLDDRDHSPELEEYTNDRIDRLHKRSL